MHTDKNIEPSFSERFTDVAETGILLVGSYLGAFNEAAVKSAIPKNVLLPLLKDALKEERIEPYLATLLLVSNLGQPVKYRGKVFSTWEEFFPVLMEIHNAEQPSFNTKRRHFLKSLQRAGFSNHKQLDETGLTKNYFHPNKKDYHDTAWDVLVAQDDKIPHDRKPTHVNNNGVVESNESTSKKSYAAIPKKVLLPLIKEARAAQRMNDIQTCLIIAINAHAMELRRDGTRYIDHVMAVASDPALTPRQSLIAILHDVLENSLWTAEDLRSVGLDNALVNSVEHLTKRDDETVYLEFIQRVSTDADALAVKMADIRHNIRTAKADKVKKYELALMYLETVKRGGLEAGSSIRDFARSINRYDENLFKPEDKNLKGANDNQLPSMPVSLGNPPAPGPSWAA